MIRLVAMYGTGDTYLVCALARAFQETHGEAKVIVKAAHAFLPRWFELDFEVDDRLVGAGETDQRMKADHPNDPDSQLIFVHPTFVRTPARLDQLTVKPRATQADMYRALLCVSPWAPLTRPREIMGIPGDVVVIPAARSWPNLPLEFWETVCAGLVDSGRHVVINDPKWTLEELLRRCAGAAWVIGPQCGTVSIVHEARFPCRKTIVITKLDEGTPGLFNLTQTMPYAHCSTFAGSDHEDVEHVVVSDWQAAYDAIWGRQLQFRLRPR